MSRLSVGIMILLTPRKEDHCSDGDTDGKYERAQGVSLA